MFWLWPEKSDSTAGKSSLKLEVRSV